MCGTANATFTEIAAYSYTSSPFPLAALPFEEDAFCELALKQSPWHNTSILNKILFD